MVCGDDSPGHTLRRSSRGFRIHDLLIPLAGFMRRAARADAPVCLDHLRSERRRVRIARIGLAGVVLIALIYVDPILDGYDLTRGQRNLLLLAYSSPAGLLWLLWRWLAPSGFELHSYGDRIECDFRDGPYAREFARSNDGDYEDLTWGPPRGRRRRR